MLPSRQSWFETIYCCNLKDHLVLSRFRPVLFPSQYVATQCGVVYELGERRETDMVGQVR